MVLYIEGKSNNERKNNSRALLDIRFFVEVNNKHANQTTISWSYHDSRYKLTSRDSCSKRNHRQSVEHNLQTQDRNYHFNGIS